MKEAPADAQTGRRLHAGREAGRSNQRRTLAPNLVIALTLGPARVNTSTPVGSKPAADGLRAYTPNAGWPLAREGIMRKLRPGSKITAARNPATSSRPAYCSG